MKRVLASPRRAAVSDKIFAEPFVNLGGKQKYTVLVSILAHTLIIAAAIIVPVVATDSLVLPARFMLVTFTEAALPPSPPPPRGGARQQLPVTKPAVPLLAPEAIIPESRTILTPEPIAEFDTLGVVKGGDYFAPPPAPSVAPVPDQVPFRVGGDVKRPVKVKDVAPVYPAIARASRVEGIVIVEATIGPDGKVEAARILRSVPLLDAEALEAVRRWEYTPTLLNGVPVAVVMTVTVDFRLR
jgi:protein TonB